MDGRRGTFVAGVALLVVSFLLLTRCGGGGVGSERVGAVRNRPGPVETRPITSAPAPVDISSDDRQPVVSPSEAPVTPTSQIMVDGEPLLPLSRADRVGPDGDLTGLSRERARARLVRVISVPADEGFWVGDGPGEGVWVQLTGPPPESPYTVRPGDRVSFTAVVSPNGRDFARRVGVGDAEGARRLTAQRQHLQVAKRSLALHHRR